MLKCFIKKLGKRTFPTSVYTRYHSDTVKMDMSFLNSSKSMMYVYVDQMIVHCKEFLYCKSNYYQTESKIKI